MNTEAPRNRFGRTMIIAATAIGVTIGAAGLAGAAQSVLGGSDDLVAEITLPGSDDSITDNTTDDTTGSSTDDTTAGSTDDSTDDSVTDDSVTDDSVTDDSVTDNTTDDSSDDSSGPSSSNPGAPLPAPFSQTYNSTGGSITVSWTGTAFVLDSVSAADGYTAQIEDQRWDRIRVDFEGDDADSRIEVRISDDDNSVRVRIG